MWASKKARGPYPRLERLLSSSPRRSTTGSAAAEAMSARETKINGWRNCILANEKYECIEEGTAQEQEVSDKVRGLGRLAYLTE